MVATLNYDLKNAPGELWESSRWAVLTMLILHANIRNRCWPSIDYLAHKLSKSTATIEAALKWLKTHGALALVPFKERVDDERQLPNRQHVYQLTGNLTCNEQSTFYLYVSPVNGQVLETETSKSEVSKTKVLVSKSFKTENLTIPNKDSTESNPKKDSAPPANAVSPAQPDQPTQPANMLDSVAAFGEAVEPNETATLKEKVDVAPMPSPEPSLPKVPPKGFPSEPLTTCNPLPALPDGLRWYMVAGDNDLLHVAKPTHTGKLIKPICGHPGLHAIPAQGAPVGKRQPCMQCQRSAVAPPPPKERPRDLVFDAIALGSFNMTQVANGSGGRIAKVAKQVKECTPAEHLATLPQDLTAMYAYFKRKYPALSAPSTAETICKYLAEVRVIRKPTPNGKPKADPHCGKCGGNGWIDVFQDGERIGTADCDCMEVHHG